MARSLDIPAPDGAIDAQLFTPASPGGTLPGVILFPDIGGVRPAYHDKAQKVANAGYAVLLPNIFYRSARGQVVPHGKSFRDPDVMPKLMAYRATLTPDAQARDFAALLAGLDGMAEIAAGPIGVIGYCMTGAFAVRFAALQPDRVAAAAAFHSAWLAKEGEAGSVHTLVGTIRARVYLGHADKDEYLPPDEIGRLDAALAEANVHFTTELYKGAHHGWTAADAPSYDPKADALHYKRLLTLLDEALKTA